jgi:peptide-methionine (R)-S-oxide reductase
MLTWAQVIERANKANPEPDSRVERDETHWRRVLSAEQFYVMREKGTEPSFSAELCHLFTPGCYACSACNTPLFNADEKFDSGSGWPSFTQTIKDNVVNYHLDNSHAMQRVETTCSSCDAHLGHVFADGPEPSGLRYCMNAVALTKTNPLI